MNSICYIRAIFKIQVLRGWKTQESIKNIHISIETSFMCAWVNKCTDTNTQENDRHQVIWNENF